VGSKLGAETRSQPVKRESEIVKKKDAAYSDAAYVLVQAFFTPHPTFYHELDFFISSSITVLFICIIAHFDRQIPLFSTTQKS
jgi:hypothetical protein